MCGDSPWTAVEQGNGTWQLVASLDIVSSPTAGGNKGDVPPAATDGPVSPSADGSGVAAAAAPGTAAEPSEADAVPPPPAAPRDWKAEAASLEHMLTHKPFNI